MIAKRVQRKSGEKSSYGKLALYILGRKSLADADKVRSFWSTNCAVPDDMDLCIKEISANQDLNSRSKNDKTYHLVVSLAEGEDLSDEQFQEVERKMCEAIGLGEHQRICAVHTDTSHIHLHLAISKIHPLSLNCVEPYYDKLKLQAVCRELEQEYSLKPGIREEGRVKLSPGEAHQGLESFASWIRTHLEPEFSGLLLSPDCNWQSLQALSGRFGIEIRERGAGLVFSHLEKKLFVKASDINRSFSKKRLEDRLGRFEPSQWKGLSEKTYKPGPLQRSEKKDKLFEEFLAEKENWLNSQNSVLSSVSEVRYRSLQEIKERYARRRLEIKRDTLIAKGRKRFVYQKLSEAMQKEIAEVFSEASQHRREIYERSKPLHWRDWVYERAKEGNETALEILRSKLSRTEDFGLGSFVGRERNHVIFSGLPKNIRNDGSIEYQAIGGGFVDRGDAIVLRSLDEKTVKAAFTAARIKYGEQFDMKGSQDFMLMVDVVKKGPKIASEKDVEQGAVKSTSKGRDL